MQRANRDDREEEIEAAAYRLLEEHGFAGAGMQAIARAARASNETLYRWYGDKTGLFRALIMRNASLPCAALEQAHGRGERGLAVLRVVGPVLLTMLLSDRAMALNRAAAADDTGELGRTLAEAGRQACAPKFGRVMQEAQATGELARSRDGCDVLPRDLAELWLTLLVGDLQMRRVTGAIPPLTAEEIGLRNARALDDLSRLYPPADADPPA
ncbi:TetR/AcrR family transcriptional regulator [Paracoccus lutimaris]|uniref:TetR family transcriptional regulator n=1 Tax=Paracoccus lutimaris TaxID=1490030 RepID=A0A368Z091_9RHOB|nr:TetR/AcrR family transcriptional regulator [Paracoccus lutimaris]RCW85873.1 TetR family transcriptional regulator [Paracoccus lutimaris]